MAVISINGCSAGGLATYSWLDQISERVKKINPSVKVFGMADSGMFPIYDSLRTGTEYYRETMK